MENRTTLTINEPEEKSIVDRLLEAVEKGNATYSVASEFILAVDMQKVQILETLLNALNANNFSVVSIAPGILVITNTDLFAIVKLYQRSKYCTLYTRFWTPNFDVKGDFEKFIKKTFNEKNTEGTLCGLRWVYNSRHGMSATYIEELLMDVVFNEAYPSIVKEYGSIKNFADTYLKSDESILVLQGPAGTGKSRLIRYVMARLAETKKIDHEDDEYNSGTNQAKSLVLYTSDTDSLKGDELFATFMTSDEVMFVVEDADNMLRSRANGNDHLHRFLTVSDGIIRNVGRKVVFTTNLPNIGDIDEALVRPGRCFARLTLGGLNREEAFTFALKLNSSKEIAQRIIDKHFVGKTNMTLAEIYKACKDQSK